LKACFYDVPQLKGVARCPGMTLAPGFVAVLGTIPVGDKVALEEVAPRVLSTSLTPREVFGRGEARRKLARRASLRTCTVWRLLLVLSS
jgi:hypothetical protein